jgi:hypothetical protein
MKLVVNKCYGGYSISTDAMREYVQRKYPVRTQYEEKEYSYWTRFCVNGTEVEEPDRDDPILVAIVEEWGDLVNGSCAKLKVVTIPDGTDWQIDEYDGMEWVAEKHQTWG